MVTTSQHNRPHSIKIDFCDESVTSFGGLVLAERLGRRLRLDSTINRLFPSRKGYDWLTCLKSIMFGLLSGSQGTYATQGLREDESLLKLLSLQRAPEEVTVWRLLAEAGQLQSDGLFPRVQWILARRVLEKIARPDLLLEGFLPVFGDGTLLEGSTRREGTKHLKDKGSGLMLTNLFVGPVLSSLRLAAKGEGEQSCLRSMLADLTKEILKPLRLQRQALLLLDSLHGDDPTLCQIEESKYHYVVGANKLKQTKLTLLEQPESQWSDDGPRSNLGWSKSGTCVCSIQCGGWKSKRVLIGRRWMLEGEMIWNYSGVMSNLKEKDVGAMIDRGLSFARAIWRLYDAKAGMETQFKDGLSDLGLHHPPCHEHIRNSGFYAIAGLAWLLGVAVDCIGGQSSERGSRIRKDGQRRKRCTPKRMRLWRVRRELLSVPARIIRHARTMTIQFLGLSSRTRQTIDLYWANILRC